MQKSTDRLEYLDSTRGIAALVVLIFHTNDFIFYNILDESTKNFLLTNKIKYLLSILFNGVNAVSYFFVLSGFVLSYSYLKKNASVSLITFSVKRLFRIFPLYILIVFIAFIFNYRSTPVGSFAKELLIFPNIHELIPPGWSMTIELSLSFLVPFLIYLVQKKQSWFIALILISIPLAKHLSPYIFHFMIGILLAKLFCVKTVKTSMNFLMVIILGVIAFAVYSIRPIIQPLPSFVHTLDIVLSYLGANLSALYAWAAAIGSACFIYYIIFNEKVKKLLMLKPLVFIGKISYGIYLVHWLIIYYVLNNFINFFINKNTLLVYVTLNIIVIVLSIISSSLFHYLIELPFIEKGKKAAIATHGFIKQLKNKKDLRQAG